MSTALTKVLAILLVATPLATSAATVSFSYSGSLGSVNVSASGQMQIADVANVNGSFDILGISGTRTVDSVVENILGLASSGPFTFDNDLFLDPLLNSGRYFTDAGLLYLTGSNTVNVFNNILASFGPLGYGESSSPANPGFIPWVSPLALSIQRVPEPGSLALVGLGLMGLAGLRRQRR